MTENFCNSHTVDLKDQYKVMEITTYLIEKGGTYLNRVGNTGVIPCLTLHIGKSSGFVPHHWVFFGG